MTKHKTFAQQIRESYGDTVEQFAQRLNTAASTVEGWEAGQELQETAEALLKYANEYPLAIHPRISDDFAKLDIRAQLKLLMKNFGDSQRAFADRIGLSAYNISRWMRLNIISSIAQRYIYEVAVYPERFHSTPQSYAK
jgi:transcriptional regulator with XRE-family HTH domain